MTSIIGRGFAELRILKMWTWPYLLNWVEYCNKIAYTKECQIPFVIDRGFAEVQILKRKLKLALSLGFEYFDKILRTH